ncbi:MAG: hypothetical protein WCC04_20155 [Terriglobales bacterium]
MRNRKLLIVAALALAVSVPTIAAAKKKKTEPRGMLESMQSLPCGVKEKGLNGLGAVWGSIGVTSVSSNEKLCPQYLFRTDELEYYIRPTDSKHPVLLPIGREAEFKVKKDKIFLKVPDGDGKTRAYRVISMEPMKSAHAENTAYSPASSPPVNRPPATVPLNQPERAVDQTPPSQNLPPPR